LGVASRKRKPLLNLVNKDLQRFVIYVKIVMIFRVRLCVGVKSIYKFRFNKHI
jgi:hypothetical protein